MEEHDNSYRKFFSFPSMVKDLITAYVEESWVNELNFEIMEPVETSFVSSGLRRREADVIWRIQWRKRWLYVYVLIEMQSRVDPMMAVRLLTYTGLLYQDLVARKELTPSGYLPPVLPITLYNGNSPWSAATKLSDVIEQVPKSLSRYQPQFEYFLLDETQVETKGKGVAGPARPNLVTALIDLDKSQDVASLKKALDQLIDWISQDTPEHRRLSKIFTVWLSRSLLPSRFPGVKLPKLRNLLEAKDMLAERVTEWTKEWEQQGLEKGLEKGRKDTLKQIIANMLNDGASSASISRATGLSAKKIAEIKNGLK